MNSVDLYIEQLEGIRKERILKIVEYIRNTFEDIEEGTDYAPKTKFPIFRIKGNPIYVAVASQKNYLAIHFGRYDCVSLITEKNPKTKGRVGCVNITDKQELPMKDIKEAIDLCFKDK